MPQIDQFLYTRGQTGRGVVVDSSGRLIGNSDLGAGPFIYSYGDTGRPLTVDSSGRLLINLVGSGGGGGGGEINTASNVGASGIGVFSNKSGVDLRFKNVASGSSKIQILQNGNVILVDADQSQFLLNSIGGTLAVSKGGTDATTEGDARINLGLAIGVDVQAHDDQLDQIAILTPISGAVLLGDGSQWTIASGIYVENAENLGAGSGIFFQKNISNNLELKSLVAGGGIQITGTGDELTIASVASGAGEANTASNVGQGVGTFNNKSGVDLRFRSLLGGSGIEVSLSGQTIRLDSEISDDFNILQSDHNTLRTDFDNSSGVFRTDIDTNTTNVSSLQTDFDNSSGVFVKNAENVGGAESVFSQKNANQNLELRTILGGSGINVTTSGSIIRVDNNGDIGGGAGEANTASNVGSGIGVFHQKTGIDLEFRGILQGSGIQIALSGSTIIVDSTLEDDVQLNTSNVTQIRNDFDNSSGIFRGDIDSNTTNITNLQTDFTNSSGVFQTGVDTANSVRIDFDNSSGIFRADIDTNTTNISSITTDFTNSSGVFQAGTNTANQVRTDFDNSSGIFVKDGSNLGTGSGWFTQKNASQELEFKVLTAGTNISISGSATELRISAASGAGGGGGGEANTASNLGTGSGIFAQKNGVDLEFKSLIPGSNIGINQTANELEIYSVSTAASSTFQKSATFVNPSLPIEVVVWRANKSATISNVYAYRQGGGGDNTTWNVRINGTSALAASGDTFLDNTWTAASLSGNSDLSTGDTLSIEVGDPSGLSPAEFTIAVDMRTDGAIAVAGSGEPNTASNVGLGVGPFHQKTGIDLEFRSLLQGSGIQVSLSGSTIRIDNSLEDDVQINTTNISSLQTDFTNSSGIFQTGTDTANQVRTDFDNSSGIFQAGVGTANQTRTDFDNSSGIFVKDGENLGTGSGIFVDKTSQNLRFKSLLAGQNVEITGNATELIISATPSGQGGSGEANDGLNLGVGREVFRDKVGLNLRFRTLFPGSGIIATQDTTHVVINTSGVTGENLGLGQGLFTQTDLTTLQFRSLLQGSGIILTASGNTVRVDSHLEDDISINTNNITTLQTDFTNSSGTFQGGTDVANQVRTDFDNSSGIFRSDIDQNTINVSQIRTDFDNSSGVFRGDIDANTTNIANLQTDFTNSSGNFQTGVDTANQVRTDFDNSSGVFDNNISTNTTNISNLQTDFTNSSGVFRGDIDTNTTNISNLQTNFANSSGVFQTGTDTANAVRTDFDNSSGVFRSDIDTNITNISSLQTNFTNSSGIFQTGTDTANEVRTDFDNSSGIFLKNLENLGGAESIFVQKNASQNAEIRTLLGGSGINVTVSGSIIRFDDNGDIGGGGGGETNTASNIGQGVGVFDNKNVFDLEFRSLLGGSGLEVSLSGTTIRFDNEILDDFNLLESNHNQLRTDFDNSSGIFRGDIDSNTTNISNLQTDFNNSSGIFQAGTDTANTVSVDFNNSSGIFRNDIDTNTSNISQVSTDFTNSSGVFRNDIDQNTSDTSTLRTDFDNSSGIFQGGTNTANQVRTDFDNASGIWVKDGENLGLGSGVFVQKNASNNLEFRTLLAGTNVGINQTANTLEIYSTGGGGGGSGGEQNTASNVGIGDGQVFAQKNGVDLEFRRILAGSGIIIATSGDSVVIDNHQTDDVDKLASQWYKLNIAGDYAASVVKVFDTTVPGMEYRSGQNSKWIVWNVHPPNHPATISGVEFKLWAFGDVDNASSNTVIWELEVKDVGEGTSSPWTIVGTNTVTVTQAHLNAVHEATVSVGGISGVSSIRLTRRGDLDTYSGKSFLLDAGIRYLGWNG